MENEFYKKGLDLLQRKPENDEIYSFFDSFLERSIERLLPHLEDDKFPLGSEFFREYSVVRLILLKYHNLLGHRYEGKFDTLDRLISTIQIMDL